MAKKTEQQVNKELREEVERVGYGYIKGRKKSSNPDDRYLRVVLAKNNQEYVVWLYNTYFGGLYINEGKHVTDLESAEKYYNSK